MRSRVLNVGVPLAAALLMVWVLALAPAASAAGTPPKPVGSVPSGVSQ